METGVQFPPPVQLKNEDMAKTTLYNLVRDTKAEPLDSSVVTHLEFYTDQSGTFTVEEKHKGTSLNRTAYHSYELAKILQEWQDKGFTIY